MKSRLLVAILALLPALCFASDGSTQNAEKSAAGFRSELLDAIPFRLVGPASPAGRVWQVVGVPAQPKTFYVCTADGGVWKTDNNGTTLIPIFDGESTSSCGAVAIAPSDPNQVWAGTGEPASTRANSLGRGVFHSSDGGATWQFAGLAETEEISAVVIDPRDTRVVYVAALGHLWGKNPERGIFKTTDAGSHWEKALYIDDATGISDLQLDPHNPDVLYAAAWQRLRFGDGDMAESGPGGGIYKTTNAGKTWTRLTNGLPTDPTGKITVAVALHNSQIVYAAILTGEPSRLSTGGNGPPRTSAQGGVFRSEDGGGTWQRMNPMQTSYYYDRIVADPRDDNRVWMPVFELMRSDDGGRTWVKHNMKHVHDDLHSLWIDSHDPEFMMLGGDGGVNTTFDGGRTWIQNVLPIAQFYEVNVDDQEPYWVYAGMQDTAGWAGPSQTYDNEGITNYDWIKLRYNGDGMGIAADPRDPNVIYMLQELGNTSRLDLHTWSRQELQPPAEMARKLGLHPIRWDWTPPMLLATAPVHQWKHAGISASISAGGPELYLGANYVFRCHLPDNFPKKPEELGEKLCKVISLDLTAQQERERLVGVRDGYHSYGALFSLSQSPVDPHVLWAGADDGPIWVARDLNEAQPHWTRVDTNLGKNAPTNCVVSKIEPSRTGAGVAYVAYDCHTRDDRHPYLYRTADFGKTWTNITGDLPAEGSTYVIREDSRNPHVLFVGTEFGLYVTIDDGGHWVRWKSNLPMAAVRAMVIQPRERELVASTFGRAIWIADIAVIEQLADALAQAAYLFDVKPAVAYNIRYTYGATIEELNGDMFFRAENPPYGTMIVYYLGEALPGQVHITIRDSKGSIVRTLGGPGTAGLHRIQWDLETDAAKAEKPAPVTGDEPKFTLSEQQALRRVAPGTYRVEMQAGSVTLKKTVEVRAESDGVRSIVVRK